MPLKILVLSSTRKERDGIAESTRQVFRPDFQKACGVEARIADIGLRNVLSAPFSKADILHIQHEFFLFDRLVGMSALVYYPYLWLWSKLLGFKIVSTVHSTYNVDELDRALPHFSRFKWMFPLGRIYLRLHLMIVCMLSSRIIVLSRIGQENLCRVISQRIARRKLRYVHLGNYTSNIRVQCHGLLASRFGVSSATKLFTLFGFAFPNKGYEYAIEAMAILIHEKRREDVMLVIVSGETGKSSFPGGGQGDTYLGRLKRLAIDLRVDTKVLFTGYLANEDPLLEDIFAETLCFIFPYLNRNFPSGAISTTLSTGKPMLVSDIPCFQEYERLPNFPEKDARALAERMAAFLDDPVAAAQAAEITRYNAKKFGMDRIFGGHLEIYREALGESATAIP